MCFVFCFFFLWCILCFTMQIQNMYAIHCKRSRLFLEWRTLFFLFPVMQRGCWCSHTPVARNRPRRLQVDATTEISALKSVWEHSGAWRVISVLWLRLTRLHCARFRSLSIPFSQFLFVCFLFHQTSSMYPCPPLTSLYFLCLWTVCFSVEDFTRKMNKLMHDTRPVSHCWGNNLKCAQAQVLCVTQCGPMFLHLHCEQNFCVAFLI